MVFTYALKAITSKPSPNDILSAAVNKIGRCQIQIRPLLVEQASTTTSVLAELGHSSFQIRPLVTQKLMATTDRQPTSEPCRSRPFGTTPRRPQLTPQPRAEAVSFHSQIQNRPLS
jgi:hypothetical protein